MMTADMHTSHRAARAVGKPILTLGLVAQVERGVGCGEGGEAVR